jgi:uncharacterized membrane protein YkvA (DUF1232 family)
MNTELDRPDDEYSKQYSEEKFWDKLVRRAKAAGYEVVEKALWLYYAAQEPGTPKWAKGVIIAALGYFIFPLDALPDVMPFVGYSDDLGVLAAAVAAVAIYITADVKEKARAKMKDWFGSRDRPQSDDKTAAPETHEERPPPHKRNRMEIAVYVMGAAAAIAAILSGVFFSVGRRDLGLWATCFTAVVTVITGFCWGQGQLWRIKEVIWKQKGHGKSSE